GLVFNTGERVEGMSNFLWTLWIGAGLGLGVSPETWTVVWGLVSLAAVIVGLGVFHVRMRRRFGIESPTVPLGALAVAGHAHVLWFATGGLETMAFTAMMLAVFLMLTTETRRRGFDAATGVVAAMCALMRPEGLLAAGLGAAYLWWVRRGSLVAFAAGFAALWAPVTIGRVLYYGDFFPNTVYAKSNAYGRIGQGLFYVRLYFTQYWPLLLGIPLALLRWRRLRAHPAFVLAAAFALSYTAFVVGVAGDFMHARFMIPATPFFALLLDAGVLSLVARRRWVQPVLAIGLSAAVVFSRHPFAGVYGPRGIADEPLHYTSERGKAIDLRAALLKSYTEGLDYSVAFFGGEARLVYRARVPLAIECETGLTDRFLAHRSVSSQSGELRIGHEKTAPLSYLIDQREIDLVFFASAPQRLGLQGMIPQVDVRFGMLNGWLLHWDVELVKALRERGVEVDDFPAVLDRYIASMPAQPQHEVAQYYEQFKRFYFDHVDDPARQAPFEQRLR
ncbi:MAG TPA: hypothetical protein VFU38_07915, partial [Candidatus Krumholzibacteria bacterium]|nr:hypothetical protein [Candidatus Krumholzibacteria bacterium]